MTGGAPRRVFLGWRSPLDAVVAHLTEHHGGHLHELLVALPGRRAGRLLTARLAEQAQAVALPEVLTAGHLPDRLLALPGRPAERLTRSLVWAEVLAAAGDLSPLLARPPQADDLDGWLALAATLRSLHAELRAEGRDFADVAAEVAALAGEQRRWRLLARLQDDYRQRLASLGLVDPHDARWEAADAGRLLPVDGPVIVAGVTRPPALLRRVLEALGERVELLVTAPAERSGDVDACGGLVSEAWTGGPIDLPEERWWLEDRPVDQADRVAALLSADPEGACRATVAVPDEALTPVVCGRLAAAGLAGRPAAGTPLERSAPVRLLRQLAAYLDGRTVADLAALLRDPHLESLLRGDDPTLPAEHLDAFDAEHLPRRVPARWRPLPGKPRDRHTAAALQRLTDGLDGLLGALADPRERRPLAGWTGALRDLARALWQDRPLDEDPVLAAALERLGSLLVELEALPPGLGAPVGPARALRTLASWLAAGAVPPPPDDTAVELLGWLELAFDDGDPLIVTGFNDGQVPESVGAHPFLPDGLRRRLGLPHDDDRLARDAFLLTGLLASGRSLHLVSGRRSAAGDPLRPSRLAFLCPPDQLPGRVRRAFAEPPPPAPGPPVPEPPRRQRPAPGLAGPLTSLAVTDVKVWLGSPYAWLLTRHLRLERCEDGARELDPPLFGTLVHDVLEAFGRHDDRHLEDPERLATLLADLLADRVRERFGRAPRPAVAVQLEQLGRRLAAFARHQAARRAAGWRLEQTEWSPEGGAVLLDVDGEPVRLRGRIDRIDRHELDGRFALLDYKTSDRGEDPRRSHGPDKAGRWQDLQLVLYRLLARELIGSDEPELGYVNLPADEQGAGFRPASWTAEELADGEALAAEVVRRIRAGDVQALGRFRDRDELLAAVARLHLVGAERPARRPWPLPPVDGITEGAR